MVMAVDTPVRNPGGAAVLEKAPERVRKRSPRYKVLLHNDPVNTCLLYTSDAADES